MAKAYSARPTGTKAVRLDLTADDHARLFDAAHDARVPMSQFVRAAVLAAIERQEKKSGKKSSNGS